MAKPESEQLLGAEPPPLSCFLKVSSALLLEKLLIPTYQTQHACATNVWLNQTKNTIRHVSRCGFHFYLVAADGADVFPGCLIWKPSSLKCLLTSFVYSLMGSLFPFLLRLKISFHGLCQVCGLHTFSPFLQMLFSSLSRVFCSTIIFFNLQRSRAYQSSVCR